MTEQFDLDDLTIPTLTKKAIQARAKQFLEQHLGDQRGQKELLEMIAEAEYCLEDPQRYPDFLAVEYNAPRYRIDKLWPTGGTALLAARYKSGKSTLKLGLIRCLTRGEDFLGQPVVALNPDQCVLDVNLEVDERTQQHYARPFDLPSNAMVLNLRGQAKAFNILSDLARGRIAAMLKDNNVQVLIVDPVGPLLRAFGLNENSNSSDGGGAIVEAMNELSHEAGDIEVLLIHHTGHGAQRRARGGSVFGDSADALWSYRIGGQQRGDDEEYEQDEKGTRYFSATGRLESDIEEFPVYFDPRTHRLSRTPSIL
jgi:RecA-family ATPase